MAGSPERHVRGPRGFASIGSWHTATAEPRLGQAGHLGRWCRREGSEEAVNRYPGGGPSAPMFSTMLCSSPQLLYFLYFYTWTADHFCGEGDETSVLAQWLMLILVTAGRLLHQRGGAEFIKALLENSSEKMF